RSRSALFEPKKCLVLSRYAGTRVSNAAPTKQAWTPSTVAKQTKNQMRPSATSYGPLGQGPKGSCWAFRVRSTPYCRRPDGHAGSAESGHTRPIREADVERTSSRLLRADFVAKLFEHPDAED